MKKFIEMAERLMFGATAEEAVAARIALTERQIEQALVRLVAALEDDDPEPEPEGEDAA